MVIVDPPDRTNQSSPEDIDAMLTDALAQGMSVRDAADTVSQALSVPRRPVYQRALALAKGPETA